jgi:hypothetical protein
VTDLFACVPLSSCHHPKRSPARSPTDPVEGPLAALAAHTVAGSSACVSFSVCDPANSVARLLAVLAAHAVCLRSLLEISAGGFDHSSLGRFDCLSCRGGAICLRLFLWTLKGSVLEILGG